jgi:hypothetical protein
MAFIQADPLYSERDAASRDLIRQGIIYDNFGTNYPLMGLLKEARITEVLFQGTGLESAYIYDYANGSATQPGSTITPQRKQMASDLKYDEKFYQSNLPIDQTTYKLFNAPGETQKFSQEDLDTFCMTKQIELMIEMDAYRHGQPSSGTTGGSTTGVSDNRFLASNGFDEFFNNGIDAGPFGNVYTLVGYQKRNGKVGQALNSTPYFCGNTAGNPGSISYPVLERALAQLTVLGAKAKIGFSSPFGVAALAVMFRAAAVVQHLQVTETTDFGWRSVDFGGIKVHEDPVAPSTAAWQFLPGGNPAAYGTASPAKFYDGVGSSTKLVPFLSPTYTINGAAVATGVLSPTGSNIPSNTLITPGEVLYFIDPEALLMTPPKPGSGWEFDDRIVQIPDNISTDNRFMRLATNITTPQPNRGMIIFGFRSI